MQLHIKKREAARKSEAKALRREGKIPAVIYHSQKDAEPIFVDATEYTSALKSMQPGRLSTSKFTLKGDDGKSRTAILKDIQYNPVNYDIIHLDFEELVDKVPVNVKVPVECVGVMDCPGLKLGGFLRQVNRFVRINCLPKDIPTHFALDISSMNIYETKRVKDLQIGQALKALTKENDVVVVIAKR